MSLLHHLPEIIEMVCLDWLGAKELVSLDSACSNRHDRVILQKPLCNMDLKSVVLTRELTIKLSLDFFAYIEWVRKRRCQLAPVNVDLDLDVILQLTHEYPFVGELAINCELRHKEAAFLRCLEKCFTVFPKLIGLAVLNAEITLSILQRLTTAPSHMKLGFFAFGRLSKQAYADKVLLPFLARYKESLKSFSMDLQPISRAVLEYLCQHCTQLQELFYSNEDLSADITRDQFAKSVFHCRNLRIFNIQDLDMDLTTQEISQLAAHNPHLETVKVSGAMQGVAAMAILSHCPKIEQMMAANICYSAREEGVEIEEDGEVDKGTIMRYYSVPQRSVQTHGTYADLLLDIGALASSFASEGQLREFLETVPAVHSVALVCDDDNLNPSNAHNWLRSAWVNGKHAHSLETICLLGTSARFAPVLLQLLRVCPLATHIVVEYSSESRLTSAQIEKCLIDPLCTYGQLIEKCYLCNLPTLTSKQVERLVDTLPNLTAIRLCESGKVPSTLKKKLDARGIELLE
ncbi:hypothetical protein EON65_48205 [archaeon]|nr:MAG: hypothetical protein EON65_48205 [archaeon]